MFHHNISSSSDDDEEQIILQTIQNNNLLLLGQSSRAHGSSVPGHKTIFWDKKKAAANLFRDYFAENPTYNDEHFRRRFRMSRQLFVRIVGAVKNYDPWFVQRRDAGGKQDLSTLQKITAAFRILAYSLSVDATDEYIKIGESTAIECVKRFCRAIRQIFAPQYLRSPTAADVARLLYIGKQRGFPGMLGSLDCMHWKWKNCPLGRSEHPTIILEAVADYDLWIWDAHFGIPGTNNDINVLETSDLINNLALGISPSTHYVINGKEFNMGYYLSDGIYPKWATIVQTICAPVDPKKRYFAMKQEACKEDVERAFGVLQSRFAIVSNPTHFLEASSLGDIMISCIIMHNMIIEDERDLNTPIEVARDVPATDIELEAPQSDRFRSFISRSSEIEDANAHFTLQNALIDHLWNEYSSSNN